MTIYSIASELNDSKYYDYVGSARFCTECDSILNTNDKAVNFNPKILGFDISYSNDGVLVFSERFVSTCEKEGFLNISFESINDDLKLSIAKISSIVTFDVEKRETRFENKCSKCDNFKSVIGATPIFISDSIDEKELSFHITDVKFGDGRAKHPLIVVNEVTKKKLSSFKLKGLRFKKSG